MKIDNRIENKARRESMMTYRTKAYYKRQHKNKVVKVTPVYNTSNSKCGCIMWLICIIIFIVLFSIGYSEM